MRSIIGWAGTVCAAALSWKLNGSVVWAIVHGLLGWIYLIYAVFFKL